MNTLHMIASSAHSRDGMADCLALLSPGDGVVLMEEGVLALSRPGLEILQLLAEKLGTSDALYYMQDDLLARGLSAPPGWQGIDMNRLVELHCQHDKSLTWY